MLFLLVSIVSICQIARVFCFFLGELQAIQFRDLVIPDPWRLPTTFESVTSPSQKYGWSTYPPEIVGLMIRAY